MLTDGEFRLFRNLIYEESGIYLKDTRKDFLENRLLRRMTATKSTSPYWYYKLVTATRNELLVLLDILTINETSFFRNMPQMDFFRKVLLPEVIKGKLHRRLRIWSAGCSTGEEPYTVAIVVSEVLENTAEWDIRIFASDLSLSALGTAAEGSYAKDKVLATVEDRYVARYFEDNGDRLRVRDSIKKMVIFDFHNLKRENGLSDLDIIFCRNVMIYFDAEDQKALVEKFHRSLNPGGYLLVGHAESLQGMHTPFQFVYDNKGTAYKKPTEERKHEENIAGGR
jgi:chemotaxis protein methyltransferase CheR